MFCVLWLVFHTLALVVEGGASSASAEALAKGGANNNGAAAGNNANPGTPNGAQPNTEPLLAHLVQIGGLLFLQPVGNQVGQGSLQQLIPIGVTPQTAALLLGQTGGANANPQGQGTLGAGPGPLTLLAVLPQRNAGADPQEAMLAPNQMHLLSVAGMNNQQQPAAAAVGPAAARLRFQRSVAARLLGTQRPVTTVMAAEDEEDCSGMETEEEEQEQ